MCPIYVGTDGNAFFPSVEPADNAACCTAEPHLLEDFDFDSFLRDTDDNQAFPSIDFSFNRGELNDDCVANSHEVSSTPVTPANVISCFPFALVEMPPRGMELHKQACKVLAQDYLKQIVSIHSICKRAVGLAYPNVLQSQLLTASRTWNKLGDLLSEHCEIIFETNTVTVLETLMLDCRHGLDRISKEVGSAEIVQSLSMRQVSIKNGELIAYGCLVPLMQMLRAFTCKSIEDQKTRLHGIAASHLLNMGDADTSKTDVDDTRSILSGKTLLGVQEVKEKGYKAQVYEVEAEEEVEPTGCFLRTLLKWMAERAEQPGDVMLKSRMVSARSKLVPKKVVSIVAARQRRRVCKLHEQVLGLCTSGTAADLTKFLSRNRKAVATIEARPDDVLRESASRSSELLKCVLIHCRALNIDRTGRTGRTCLWNAAHDGNTEAINVLIESGANKELADEDGLRPLHIAVKKGHLDCVAALLTAKADIEAPDAKMNKPLHLAAEHISGCDIIDKLLDSGANINATNIKLSTPLHEAIRSGNILSQRLLMQRGADIEALRIRWETPVKYAVSYGQLDMLCTLITAGADPDALTCENKAALHSAAAHEDHKIVQVLLDAGCEIDPRGKNGSTPLYMAAQNGRIKNAQVLASQGADLHAKRKGRTPLDIARSYRNFGVLEVLEKVKSGLPMGELEKDLGYR
ncbi:hypothetical protein FKW77_003843 [Venturia effusa]|uniref:Uncharacterized protein n=1 Tax=Venturia effusa TaxID=50376 RepID=A0A517LML1_9PEZI|nr:hypothetical protein FKW77_003843 [Venturia effusa]